jgi:hypothetical protein
MRLFICRIRNSKNEEFDYPYFDEGDQNSELDDQIIISQLKSFKIHNDLADLKVISRRSFSDIQEWAQHLNEDSHLSDFISNQDFQSKLNHLINSIT